MADSSLLKFYVFFLIFLSIFVSQLELGGNTFDINEYRVFYRMSNALSASQNQFLNLLSVVLIPFMVIDILIGIIAMIGFSFYFMPPILTTIILAPLGFFIIIDYVIPMVRGN